MISSGLQEEEMCSYIRLNISEENYDDIVTQKILMKLYLQKRYSLDQKENIIKIISEQVNIYKDDLYNNWKFIKILFPIMEDVYERIKNSIIEHFDNSLFLFMYCIGRYVYENPGIIRLAKNLVISIANDVLENDFYKYETNGCIIIADSMYYDKVSIVKYIYEEAIKYGVIYEQYDNIAYNRLKIVGINTFENKPLINLEMCNQDAEYAIQMGSLYDEFILYQYEECKCEGIIDKRHPIHSYYRCKVCMYCTLTNHSCEVREIAKEIIERQFQYVKTLDLFYLFTVDVSSYICSILAFLFTELIVLLLCSEDSFRLLDKTNIKKNMMFGTYISDDEFNMCLSLICHKEENTKNAYQSRLPFFEINNKIIVGRWMYDHDFSIIEETKNIAFNAKGYKSLGRAAEKFGKEIFENIVKKRFEQLGWRVVSTAIKVKVNKKIGSDIDLIAFNNGLLVVGQIKMAHTGREPYQIWKAEKTIQKAISQANICRNAVTNDSHLLFSILKGEGIIKEKNEIIEVIYIVITSSNYFSRFHLDTNILVIGFEVLDEWLYYTRESHYKKWLEHLLKNPFNIYNIEERLCKVSSRISTEEFIIEYEEFEKET